MKSAFRIATSNDKAAIIALMREFYRVEHLFFDEQLSRAALAQLLEEPSLGAVFLIEVDDQPAGYGVVTFGFSLEFYGRFSLLDELYLRENYRGQGHGKASLTYVENLCRREGIHTLRLEVAKTNSRALSIYRQAGYRSQDREFLTKRLLPPDGPLL